VLLPFEAVDIERARYLVSQHGREALSLAWSAGLPVSNPTRLADALRKTLPPAQAAAIAEQLSLRIRAERNHGVARDILYTSSGLEMMTHPVVAHRRAARLRETGLPVIDLTTGLGGDLLACVEAGLTAVGVERDPVHTLLAAANTGVPVARGDAARPPFVMSNSAVILDPSRREGGTRRFRPEAFSPPWDVALALARSGKAAVLKAPPGIDPASVPPAAEFEAVQLAASMREVALWFGPHAEAGLRRAVLLPSGETIDSTEPAAPAGPRPFGQFLYDPESCVTRATLVLQLGHRLAAWLLDPHIAYLSSTDAAFSPLAATFELLEAMPFSVSRLKARLRARRWRPDDIRRRAFPVEPDELRRLLGKLEGERVTLLLTTLGGQRTVFICRRLFAPA
jgi:hypothetical protein